ncbi:hypothetical protein B0H14DRAFT_3744116 [Mycena olivaceomarginata]|nr:hypothetical protein B0H14DRAFT_3744116 [Mycena olivaceomarginata]
MPHKWHFIESDVPTAAYLFNSRLYSDPCPFAGRLRTRSEYHLAVRPHRWTEHISRDREVWGDSLRVGGKTTVVLRLYEAFGGHAQTQLRIAGGLGVEAAYETNLLEDIARMVGGVRERKVRAPSAAVAVREEGYEGEDVRMPPAGDKAASHQQEQQHEHPNTDGDASVYSNGQDDGDTAHALTALCTRVAVPHTPTRGGAPRLSLGKACASFVSVDLDDEAVFGGSQTQFISKQNWGYLYSISGSCRSSLRLARSVLRVTRMGGDVSG